MRSRSRLVGLVVSGALVLLIALLATLQYRWLGQVSDADREQRRTLLRHGAQDFAADFDREVTLAYTRLRADADSLAKQDWSTFAARYESWRETAKDPRMVKAVYLAGDDGAKTSLRVYRPETRVFDTAEWPEALAPIHASLDAARAASTSAAERAGNLRITTSVMGGPLLDQGVTRALWTIHEPIVPSVPALVIQVQSVAPFTFTAPASSADMAALFLTPARTQTVIVQLDREYLQSSLLPAMVVRHFASNDQYRFAIVDAADAAHPVFAQGLGPGATLDPEHADESVPLFAIRNDLIAPNFVRLNGNMDAQVTMDALAVKGTRASVPPPPPPAPLAPAPAVRPGVSVGGATGAARGDVTRSANSTFSLVVNSRGDGPRDAFSQRIAAPVTWRLVMQHTAGSLDAAVDHARIRNLWLSFGILSVLAAGVGLVVVNAERSRKLAGQQMDFVATVSHELRTPLTVIRSAAQNLSAGVVSDPAQARRYGELIESEGRRLTDMVEQVLEFAGLSGNRQLARAQLVDTGSLVRDIAESSAALFEAERCEVELQVADGLPPVLADEGAIRRAVNNLIANALKYGTDGRWIRVAAAVSGTGPGRRGGEVQISVSDRGRGIEADDLPHIFEAFYRGRYAVERQIHGNGLGLSLVSRIADAHGGRVSVTSTPGAGATFIIHLPAATPDRSAVTPLADPAPESGGQPA